jgi:hypothetical protein
VPRIFEGDVDEPVQFCLTCSARETLWRSDSRRKRAAALLAAPLVRLLKREGLQRRRALQTRSSEAIRSFEFHVLGEEWQEREEAMMLDAAGTASALDAGWQRTSDWRAAHETLTRLARQRAGLDFEEGT